MVAEGEVGSSNPGFLATNTALEMTMVGHREHNGGSALRRSVTAEEPPKHAFPACRRINGRRRRHAGLEVAFTRAKRFEVFLDLTVFGKAADLGLGEDQLAVGDHVELAGAARRDFDFFAEAGFERCSQTGRAGFVASNRTVENLRRHGANVSVPSGLTQTAGLFAVSRNIDEDRRRHDRGPQPVAITNRGLGDVAGGNDLVG